MLLNYKTVIIGVIILAVSVIVFVLVISFSTIHVHGTVTTNSTTIPTFISFTYVGSSTVKVENGSYSINIPNNRLYHVVVFYEYKIPPNKLNSVGYHQSATRGSSLCLPTILDLHSNWFEFEYNVSCPKKISGI